MRREFHRPTHPAGLAAALLAGLLFGSLAAPPAVAQTEVPAGWSLIPDGVGAGDTFRLLIVTSTTRDARSTAITDYDSHVQSAVAAGHADIQSYSSQFKVLGSTENVNARDHTETRATDTSAPVYYLNGARVSADYAGLYDDAWDSQVPHDESGNPIGTTDSTYPDESSPYVWTGTEYDGTTAVFSTQNQFLGSIRPGNIPGIVGYGVPRNAGTEVYKVGTPGNNTYSFYGLSPVFQVADGTTASTDATLSALTINDGTSDLTLDPTFVSGTYTYATDVTNAVTSVTLTATLNDSDASVTGVTLGGTPITDTDFTDGIAVPSLVVGANVIVMTVTAEDNSTTQTYTLTVNRAAANNSATGAPSISGTAEVRATLTAAKGTIADADGTTKADNGDTGYAYTYQWFRTEADGTNPAEIDGATGSIYTLVDDDEGKKVKVEVSFKDDADNAEGPLASAAYPSTGTVVQPGICGRTEVVQTAILGRISGVTDCALVTDAQLAAIAGDLDLNHESITALVAGDFAGLTALTGLHLLGNALTTLPAGVFDELTALETLDLGNNALTTLPAGVFDALTALTMLNLEGNALTTLPAGVFDGLTALTSLLLPVNPLTTLPAGVFDKLTALETLSLHDTDLTTLTSGVFDELTALTTLHLSLNALTTLPAGVFDELTALTTLNLNNNTLTTLPDGVFEKLTALTTLRLNDNTGAPFAPTADAVPDDGTVSPAGGTVTLDGSGSGGPWGANVTYAWALTSPTSGVTVTFDDAASAKPVVTTPALTAGTELVFTLTVTGRAQDAANGTAPDTDTATVTAVSTDATLGVLTVNDGTKDLTLDPTFAPGTYAYATSVLNSVTSVTLTATPNDSDGSVTAVTLGGTDIADTDFTDSIAVPSLAVGANEIVVTVTAADTTTTQTYTLTVTRVAAAEDCATDRADADWCTTMTVGMGGVGHITQWGFSDIPAFGSLDDPIIDGGGATYTVVKLYIQIEVGQAFMFTRFDTRPPHGTVFDFGGAEFTAGSSFEIGSFSYQWVSPAGLAWIEGQKVTVSANLRPSLVTATVDGTELVLTYSEDLDTNSVPAATAYTVKVDGGSGANPSALDVSGKTVTLTLATAVTSTDTNVTVSYEIPSSNPLQDESGLDAPDLMDHAVTNNTAVSTDAALSALTVNDGTSDLTLDPVFASGTYAYAVDVANAVTEVTLTATPNHSGGSVTKVTLGGTEIADTDFTNGIAVPSLAEGANEIVVTVTAEDTSTTQTYTVTVNRAAVLRWVATMTIGEDPAGTRGYSSRSPSFGSVDDAQLVWAGVTRTMQTVAAGTNGASMRFNRGGDTFADVGLVLEWAGQTLPLDSATRIGTNLFNWTPTWMTANASALDADNFEATLPAGGTGTVCLRTADQTCPSTTVTGPASTDATLSTLSVNDGTSDLTLDPAFVSGTYAYAADVTNAVTEVTLTATPNDSGGSVTGVTLGGTAIADTIFTDGIAVPSLAVGANVIVVTVTAEDTTTTQDYTVTVTRAPVGICERTPAVRTAILDKLSGVSDCADVTLADLGNVTGSIGLSLMSISALQAGDFAHLTALAELELGDNDLAALPEGVFDGLTSLTYLGLAFNDLTALNADVFSGLTALEEISLTANDLTTLPAGVFDGLTSLATLLLDSNQLASLPDGVFGDLAALNDLRLSGNPGTDDFRPAAVAAAAPSGIPVGGGDVMLDATGSSGGPWGGNVKYRWALTDPSGATLTWYPDDESATTTATVAGPLAVDTLTFTLTVDGRGGPYPDTATASVDVLSSDATLNALTASDGTSDLTLDPAFASGTYTYTASVGNAVTSVTLTATPSHAGGLVTKVTLGGTEIADTDFSDGIAVPSLAEGANEIVVTVTAEDAITTQDYTVTVTRATALTDATLSALTVNDGTSDLTLDPTFATGTYAYAASVGNAVTSVTLTATPSHSGGSVTGVTLGGTAIADTDFSDGIMVPSLVEGANEIVVTVTAEDTTITRDYTVTVTRARAGICDRTTVVQTKILARLSGVSDCADVTLANLGTIDARLDLSSESISALRAGDFANLTALEELWLGDNSLSTLPADVFADLTALEELELGDNDLAALPQGVFDGLTSLTYLGLSSNALTALNADVFSGLTALETLLLESNDLTTLPAGVFDGLTSLATLLLEANELASLAVAVLEGEGGEGGVHADQPFGDGDGHAARPRIPVAVDRPEGDGASDRNRLDTERRRYRGHARKLDPGQFQGRDLPQRALAAGVRDAKLVAARIVDFHPVRVGGGEVERDGFVGRHGARRQGDRVLQVLPGGVGGGSRELPGRAGRRLRHGPRVGLKSAVRRQRVGPGAACLEIFHQHPEDVHARFQRQHRRVVVSPREKGAVPVVDFDACLPGVRHRRLEGDLGHRSRKRVVRRLRRERRGQRHIASAVVQLQVVQHRAAGGVGRRGPVHRQGVGLGGVAVLRRHRHDDVVVAFDERGHRDAVGEIGVGDRGPVEGYGGHGSFRVVRRRGQGHRGDSVGRVRRVGVRARRECRVEGQVVRPVIDRQRAQRRVGGGGRVVGHRLVGEVGRVETRFVLQRVARGNLVAHRHVGVGARDRRRQGERHGLAGNRHARHGHLRAVDLDGVIARRGYRARVELLAVGQHQLRAVDRRALETRRQVRAHRHRLAVDPAGVGGVVPAVQTRRQLLGSRIRRELRAAEVEHRAQRHDGVESETHFVGSKAILEREPRNRPGLLAVIDDGVVERAVCEAVPAPISVDHNNMLVQHPHRHGGAPVSVGAVGGAVLRRGEHGIGRVAGERPLGCTAAVGERDLHLDRLALVGARRRVGGRGLPENVGLVGAVHQHPLEGVVVREGRRQPARVGDGADPGGQLLAHLGRTGNLRLARGGGRPRHRQRVGLGGGRVLGGHLDLDGVRALVERDLEADPRIRVRQRHVVAVQILDRRAVVGSGRLDRDLVDRVAHARRIGIRARREYRVEGQVVRPVVVFEPDPENFFVELDNLSGAITRGATQAFVRITSDDAEPTASMADVTVDEGAGSMTLVLELSHPSAEAIEYSATETDVGGTATATDDYGAFATARIAVPAGDLSGTFAIAIVDDAEAEDDETVTIAWEKRAGDRVTPDIVDFTGTIADNDPPAPVTGVVATPGNSELTVGWNAADFADGYRVQWKSGTETFADAGTLTLDRKSNGDIA